MDNRSLSNISFRKIDKEARTVEFVASDSSVDSYGTVLPVDKWDLTRFQKNGVIGYQHNLSWSSDPDNIIGKGTAFVEDDQLIVKVEFEPADLNEMAEKIFRKIQFGSINSVSVGFIGKGGHWGDSRTGEDEDVFYFDGMELCEVSIVNIPANANAVKRSIDEVRAALPAKPEDNNLEGTPKEQEIKKNSAEGFSVNDICLTMAKAAIALAENQD